MNILEKHNIGTSDVLIVSIIYLVNYFSFNLLFICLFIFVKDNTGMLHALIVSLMNIILFYNYIFV